MDIEQIIQQVMERISAGSQFNTARTSFHTHNGIDSPQTKFIDQFDVPTSYYGKSGNASVVNSSATGLEFSTLSAAGGGTGATTFTPYSVLTAGTTATGAFQNVSGVGTSGQVLTSNGASALPTWQTPKVYGGSVGSSGQALILPSGWSSGANSTGNFTVTPTLGTANYNVVASLLFGTSNTIVVVYADIGASAFTVQVSDSAGSGINEGFSFVLVVA